MHAPLLGERLRPEVIDTVRDDGDDWFPEPGVVSVTGRGVQRLGNGIIGNHTGASFPVLDLDDDRPSTARMSANDVGAGIAR